MANIFVTATLIATALIIATSKEYGLFDLKIVRALTCKGPKIKNCALIGIEVRENGKGLFMSIKVVEGFSPQVSKVTAVSNGRQLVRLQMNNPCEHLFLRPLLEEIFNVTKNCIIKKGTYTYQMNIEKIAKDYFGGSFVYGNLTFKSAMYSRDCNLSCVNLDVMMYPAGSKRTDSKSGEKSHSAQSNLSLTFSE